MPLFIKSCISLNAVSGEHLVILAHFDDVIFPTKPSKILFNIFLCLSLWIFNAFFNQKLCLYITSADVLSDDVKAFNKQFKNQASHPIDISHSEPRNN